MFDPCPRSAPLAVKGHPTRLKPPFSGLFALFGVVALLGLTLAATGCGDDFERELTGSIDAGEQDAATLTGDVVVGDIDTSIADTTATDTAPFVGGTDGGTDSNVAPPQPCTADSDCALSSGPCELDRCLTTGTCAIVLRADGTVCDDAQACTADTRCAADSAGKSSSCTGGRNICPCDVASDCAVFEDKNACNGTLYCDHSGKTPACKLNPATVVTCADNTACADVSCDPKSGACKITTKADGAACDDGQPCTKDDSCAKGTCTAGKNSCACQVASDCKPLEDGDLCNGTLYCDNTVFPSVCKVNPATVVSCMSSNDACKTNVCEAKTGGCRMLPLADGVTCTDGDICTGKAGVDSCKAGSCEAGLASCACKTTADCTGSEDGDLCNGTLFCDTSTAPFHCAINPATVVLCDTSTDTTCSQTTCAAKTGTCAKVAVADGTTCSDGDICSSGDGCASGSCAGGKNVCDCTSNADCGPFEDGDACNGTLFCDKAKAPFVCKVKPSTRVFCNPSFDSACVKATCVPQTGICAPKVRADGSDCDADGNPCTAKDTCVSGACEADSNDCDCVKDADCATFEDGNPCNGSLYCNTVKKPFKCEVNPLTVVRCTASAGGQCAQNVCDPKTAKCADVALMDGVACNADNNACSGPDRCVSGGCKAGQSLCACTKDADCLAVIDACAGQAFCDKSGASFQCAVTPNTAVNCLLPAGKSSQCAAPICLISGGKVGCDVSSSPPGTPCDDGKNWTVSDVCDGTGQCAGVAGFVCANHGDCISLDGDKNLCNGGARCKIKAGNTLGVCLPSTAEIVCVKPANPCQASICVAGTGACVTTMNAALQGQPCEDNNACTVETLCKGEACTLVSKTTVCVDGNLCTTDGCDETSGCTFTARPGAPCADGNGCTVGDTCGVNTTNCVAGTTAKDCDDQNPCTTDSCLKSSGKCAHTTLANCKSCTKAAQCVDGKPCTKDLCVGGSCSNVPKSSGGCDDGDPCTDKDACSGGKCRGKTKVCDDGKACTDDSCVQVQGKILGGCVFKTKVCDDKNPCTVGACGKTGACKQTSVADGNSCGGGGGNSCIAGSCGCGYWSKTIAPSATVKSGSLLAARNFDAKTLVFGGSGSTSGGPGGGYMWTVRLDSRGNRLGGFLDATASNNAVTGIARGEKAPDLAMISKPTIVSNRRALVLRYRPADGKKLTTVRTYQVKSNGNFAAIRKMKKDRWVIVGNTGSVNPTGNSLDGWIITVDKDGKKRKSKTLNGGITLRGCGAVTASRLIAGGSRLKTGGPEAVLWHFDDGLKQRWELKLEKTGVSDVFGVLPGDKDEAIAVGARGASDTTTRGALWAVALKQKLKDTKIKWTWDDKSANSRTVLYAGSAVAGGVIAVGARRIDAQTSRGLILRVDTAGKLLWRREPVMAQSSELLAVHVLGKTAIAAGRSGGTTPLGWVMRFGIDGTLTCK